MNKNEVNLQDIQEESREQDTSRLVDMSYTEEELAEQERATDTEGLDEDGTSIRVFHNRYVKIGLTAAAVAFAAFHIWLVFIKWTNIFAIHSSHCCSCLSTIPRKRAHWESRSASTYLM